MIDKLRHEIVTIKDAQTVKCEIYCARAATFKCTSRADKSTDTIIPFWARSRDFNVRKKFAQEKC